MQIHKISRGANKTYKTGVKFAGNKVNAVMKPGTNMLTSVTKGVPMLGRSLSRAATFPRKLSRGVARMLLTLPNAAGRIAATGYEAARHSIVDPLLAMGGEDPLVALGLSPSRKPKRITKKKPKSRRNN